ncbi:unnamed protein product [Clonostachys rhizophaga]|uniref:Uncharacterized protein n=1 Tax=Clonostachys rhizophaga TaxID=160324 RepID=A0A9N9VTM2_9HYPO|nr:unnamed protein product [Clonostachys rhizophaga]
MAIMRKKPTLKPCDIHPERRRRARSDSDDEAPSPSKIQQIGQGSIRLAQTSGDRIEVFGLGRTSMVSKVSLEAKRTRVWSRKSHRSYVFQWPLTPASRPCFILGLLMFAESFRRRLSPCAAVGRKKLNRLLDIMAFILITVHEKDNAISLDALMDQHAKVYEMAMCTKILTKIPSQIFSQWLFFFGAAYMYSPLYNNHYADYW